MSKKKYAERLGDLCERIVNQFYERDAADYPGGSTDEFDDQLRNFLYRTNLITANCKSAENYADLHWRFYDAPIRDVDVIFAQVKGTCSFVDFKNNTLSFSMKKHQLMNYQKLVDVINFYNTNASPAPDGSIVKMEYHFWIVNREDVWFCKNASDVLQDIRERGIVDGRAHVDIGLFDGEEMKFTRNQRDEMRELCKQLNKRRKNENKYGDGHLQLDLPFRRWV